nr:protein p7 [Hepacivirus otomopis]YP_009664186.1 protein p7 [Bat hepacivirus]
AMENAITAVAVASWSMEWWVFGVCVYFLFYKLEYFRLKGLAILCSGRFALGAAVLLLPDWVGG